MDKPHEPDITDEQLEELIAYLDGELPPEDAARVEKQLSTNATLREEMHRLNQTWDMLDNLQHTAVGDQFSRKTIEMITATAAAGTLVRKKSPVNWATARLVFFLFGLLLSGSLGYALGLQILEHTIVAQPTPTETPTPAPIPPDSEPSGQQNPEFKAWLASLPDDEKKQVRALSPAQQLAMFNKQDQQHDFMEWLQALPSDEKQELLAVLLDEQRDTVQEIRQEELFQKHAQVQLPSKDIQVIFDWLDEFAADHENEMLAMLPLEMESRLRIIEDSTQRHNAIMNAILARYQKLPPPEARDMADLQSRLSDEAREILASLPDQETWLATGRLWLQAALTAQRSKKNNYRRPPQW